MRTVFPTGLTGDFCCFSLFLIGVRSSVAVLEGVTSNPIALNLFSKSEEKTREFMVKGKVWFDFQLTVKNYFSLENNKSKVPHQIRIFDKMYEKKSDYPSIRSKVIKLIINH